MTSREMRESKLELLDDIFEFELANRRRIRRRSARRSKHFSMSWRKKRMAKRRGRPAGSGKRAVATETAESIGSALGAVMAKVDAWMAQRAEIARELRQAADRIMAGENPFGQRVTTPSMLAREVVKREGRVGLARKRRKMSAAARKAISEAQKARWAAQKKAAK
jgi:hypothetical protein